MTCPLPPFDRLLAQIGAIRALALGGQAEAARRLCAALFLDHLLTITRERELLEGLTECMLLLEMTALLPRLMRAVFGVGVEVVKRGGTESRHWMLQFSNGIVVLVPTPGGLGEAGASWARRVLEAAARVPEAPGVRQRVLSIV